MCDDDVAALVVDNGSYLPRIAVQFDCENGLQLQKWITIVKNLCDNFVIILWLNMDEKIEEKVIWKLVKTMQKN